jgi:tetratricopeptide (TPR) repeat protein
MAYRPGDVARWFIALAVPVGGGALATYGELVWGAAVAAFLVVVPRLRRYAAPAAVAFGLFVFARAAAAVTARGVVAVFLGFAALVAAAYVLSLWRRKRTGGTGTAQWAAALTALGTVAAAGAAALIAGPATLNLALAPLAAVAAFGAIPAARKSSRVAFVALAVGLALGSIKGGVGFALVRAAEGALARGDNVAAGAYSRYAALAGGGDHAELMRIKAAAAGGAPWAEVEAVYRERDRLSSPRPFDATLATAAFARGDYEKAAMYGDLATTASPTSPFRDQPMPRDDLYDAFAAGGESPFARAWAELWLGNYPNAAAAFSALAPSDPDARWYEAFALERAGDREAAADIYEDAWRNDRRLRAGFGLLRTRKYRGLRGEIWRELIKRYEFRVVGTKLETESGFRLSKGRLALGQTPATFTYEGKGLRPLVVIAESYGVKGLYPIVTLTVNGETVRTFYADVPGENIYEAEVYLKEGNNEIGLLFENDFYDPAFGYNRDVFVREVRIGCGGEKR